MPLSRRRTAERALSWALIGVVLLVTIAATRDAWRRVGRVTPGFALMMNGQAGAGGAPRGELAPLDVVTAVNGRAVSGAEAVLAEVERHPAGTAHTYTLGRGGERVTATISSRLVTLTDFKWAIIDGTLPGLLVLALGALVLALRPAAPETRVFLAFCLVTATINVTYYDHVFLAGLELRVAPVVSSATVALVVVLLMNPVYGRARTLVDRLFFRDRYAETRRRLRPEFLAEDAGAVTLRNIDEPVRVFLLRPRHSGLGAPAAPGAARRD
jgi:hypothetical protein